MTFALTSLERFKGFIMPIKSFDLAWIVVKDLKQAVQFYTEVVGMKLNEFHEGFGWAELAGHEGGSRLGIAQESDKESIKAGQNAVITLSVKDLAKSVQALKEKGADLVGEVVEIPQMVKLQMVKDASGNYFQLVQILHD